MRTLCWYCKSHLCLHCIAVLVTFPKDKKLFKNSFSFHLFALLAISNLSGSSKLTWKWLVSCRINKNMHQDTGQSLNLYCDWRKGCAMNLPSLKPQNLQIWKSRNLRKIKWELSFWNQIQNSGKSDFIGSSAHGTPLFLLIWRRVFLQPFLCWIFGKHTHSVQFCFDLCLLRCWMTHLQIYFQILGEWYILMSKGIRPGLNWWGGGKSPSIMMNSGSSSWREIEHYKNFQCLIFLF